MVNLLLLGQSSVAIKLLCLQLVTSKQIYLMSGKQAGNRCKSKGSVYMQQRSKFLPN